MIVDAILAGLIFYLMFPLLTGYCARQYGRSFSRWFAFGCVLPIISFFILFFLISWNEKTTPGHRLNRREKAESEKLVEDLMHAVNETEEKERTEIKNLLRLKQSS